ncbi:MATE family efflux transporter [Erwinia sp. S63]|nr:MATE family efflux transporter [Erwinia sp. S63]
MTATAFPSYRSILALAGPIIGLQLAQVALTSTDLLMMGTLGVQAVAAGGLALLLYNQLRTMCVGMVTGVGNQIAAAVGRGEKRSGSHTLDQQSVSEVQSILRAAFAVATLSAIAGGLLLVGLGYGLRWLHQSPAVVNLTLPIMFTLAPGLLPMIWLNVLRQFAVGMRRAGSLLAVTLTSIGINILLNCLFIYGWFGLPTFGLAGIGLATTLVQLWTFLVYLRKVQRDEKLSALLTLEGWRAEGSEIRRIVRMGTPIALTYGSEAAITSIATLLMGMFGPVMLAASNIVNQLAYIVYQMNIGLSQGSSILVSRAVGRHEGDHIAPIARRSFTLSFGVMGLIGLLYLFIPQAVLWPFTHTHNTPELSATASVLLWFAIAHQFFKGSQNVCIGLLRGLGNTRAGLINTLAGYWVVGIPVMALCAFTTQWGGFGVWFGLCLGFAVTSILLWLSFLRELRQLQHPENLTQQALK